MPNIENWREVEEAPWEQLPSLGESWLIKSTTSCSGYCIMITDTTGLWGEKCSEKYVREQADEWAPCIEAETAELCKLVISEMKKKVAETWSGGREEVTLCIHSKLNDMTYSWEFQLERLSDDLFRYHWGTPLLVQFHQLGTRVSQLQSELESKRQQLEELLPDDKKSKSKGPSKGKGTPLATSVAIIEKSGLWTLLQEQLSTYPQIMEQLHKLRNPDTAADVVKKEDINKANNSSNKRHTDVTDIESEEIELKKEQERRAKIQEITLGTMIESPKKKKKMKKLNF